MVKGNTAMWFKVKVEFEGHNRPWYGDGFQGQNEAEIVANIQGWHHGRAKVTRVKSDPDYPQREAKRKYWAEAWQKARANMPMLPNGTGQCTALMTLLGYSIKPSHNNNAGMLWAAMKQRGSKPKGKRADSLLTLAGPHGLPIADMRLRRLGITRFTRLPKISG